MEMVIYESPKKHRIIAVRDLLVRNNIPVISIKIHINATWGGAEESDELDVPIDDFDGKLNDVETFEMYIDEKNEAKATELIALCNDPMFFDDCIYVSQNYDEIFDIYLRFRRNNMPCDDIATFFSDDGGETYALCTDPENKKAALAFINTKGNEIIPESPPQPRPERLSRSLAEDPGSGAERGGALLKLLVVIVILVCLFLLKINGESVFAIILKFIMGGK